MEIEKTQHDAVVVLKLAGRIDSAGTDALGRVLEEAYRSQQYRVVIDMAGVKFISSAGLRILADFLTRNREQGGDTVLAAMIPKVRRVFEIIGFTNFFSIFDDVDTALVAFSFGGII